MRFIKGVVFYTSILDSTTRGTFKGCTTAPRVPQGRTRAMVLLQRTAICAQRNSQPFPTAVLLHALSLCLFASITCVDYQGLSSLSSRVTKTRHDVLHSMVFALKIVDFY